MLNIYFSKYKLQCLLIRAHGEILSTVRIIFLVVITRKEKRDKHKFKKKIQKRLFKSAFWRESIYKNVVYAINDKMWPNYLGYVPHNIRYCVSYVFTHSYSIVANTRYVIDTYENDNTILFVVIPWSDPPLIELIEYEFLITRNTHTQWYRVSFVVIDVFHKSSVHDIRAHSDLSNDNNDFFFLLRFCRDI